MFAQDNFSCSKLHDWIWPSHNLMAIKYARVCCIQGAITIVVAVKENHHPSIAWLPFLGTRHQNQTRKSPLSCSFCSCEWQLEGGFLISAAWFDGMGGGWVTGARFQQNDKHHCFCTKWVFSIYCEYIIHLGLNEYCFFYFLSHSNIMHVNYLWNIQKKYLEAVQHME